MKYIDWLKKLIKEKLKKHKHMIIPFMIFCGVSLAVTFILGYEFGDFPVKNIKTIIVNHDKAKSAQNLVDMISQNSTFDVIKYSDKDSDVKDAMDRGEVFVGIIIPENFSNNILNGQSAKILALYDGTMTSVSSAAKGKVSEILNTIKNGYLISIAEGKLKLTPQMAKALVVPMGYNSRFLGNPASNMAIFIFQGIVIVITQVGTATLGASLDKQESLLKMLGKGVVISLIGTFMAVVCSIIVVKKFNMPYRGSILAGILLALFCNMGFAFLGILFNINSNNVKEEALPSCGMVALTFLLCGYSFPVIAMPDALKKIENFIPNTHCLIPIRDIALLEYGLDDVKMHIIWLVKFAIIMAALLSMKYMGNKKKEKKKLKQNNASAENNLDAEKKESINGSDDKVKLIEREALSL